MRQYQQVTYGGLWLSICCYYWFCIYFNPVKFFLEVISCSIYNDGKPLRTYLFFMINIVTVQIVGFMALDYQYLPVLALGVFLWSLCSLDAHDLSSCINMFFHSGVKVTAITIFRQYLSLLIVYVCVFLQPYSCCKSCVVRQIIWVV